MPQTKVGLRNMRGGSSGSAARRSCRTSAASVARLSVSSPRISGESQP